MPGASIGAVVRPIRSLNMEWIQEPAFRCRCDAFLSADRGPSRRYTGQVRHHFSPRPGATGAASRDARSAAIGIRIRAVCDSLKFDRGTADNLDMGNTPLLQQKPPGSRTEKAGA
jgi:hypothetical protein